MLGRPRQGYLITQQGMESDTYRKGFPLEVTSKLGTEGQVRTGPAQAGGDPELTARAKARRLSCWSTWSSHGGGDRDGGLVDLDM